MTPSFPHSLLSWKFRAYILVRQCWLVTILPISGSCLYRPCMPRTELRSGNVTALRPPQDSKNPKASVMLDEHLTAPPDPASLAAPEPGTSSPGIDHAAQLTRQPVMRRLWEATSVRGAYLASVSARSCAFIAADWGAALLVSKQNTLPRIWISVTGSGNC